MDKSEFRQKMIRARLCLPVPVAEGKSRRIAQRVLEMPEYKRAKSIFIYLDFKNEVRTKRIIKDAERCGKSVFYPAIIEEDNRMVAAMPMGESDFRLNAWGIFEPDIYSSVVCMPGSIDAAIVPGVAFDTGCRRIGYGAGFYDRFLVEAPKIFKIGLCYEEQLQEELPNGEDDICMDAVVTEERIIRRAKKK